MDGPLIRNSEAADKPAQWPVRNQDLTLLVGETHPVDGHVDQATQQHRVPLELLFRPLHLGDVDDEALTMATLAVVDQRRRVANPDGPAVRAHQPVLTREGGSSGNRRRIGS